MPTDTPLAVEPDLVDRIFEYLVAEHPKLAGMRLDELKAAVRAEFAGERPYLPIRSAAERQRQAKLVLALFDGRNASEVARRLGVSRATVYRILKQPGRGVTADDRLTFAGNETPRSVRSRKDRRANPLPPPLLGDPERIEE